LKLSPKEFSGAWKRVVKLAQAGNVTSSAAHAVIQEALPDNCGRSAFSTRSPNPNRPHRKLPIGQIIVLLYEARRCVEKNQYEQAFEALERIEKLLCGPI
jgi:hypothetical protein